MYAEVINGLLFVIYHVLLLKRKKGNKRTFQ